MAISTCSGCKQSFYSTGTFDRHRVGGYGAALYDASGKNVIGHLPPDRRCLTSDELLALGWTQNDHGHWTTNTFVWAPPKIPIDTH